MEKLAESLSDGTVFGIISELKEIQEIKLSNLSNERNTIVKSFQVSQDSSVDLVCLYLSDFCKKVSAQPC